MILNESTHPLKAILQQVNEVPDHHHHEQFALQHLAGQLQHDGQVVVRFGEEEAGIDVAAKRVGGGLSTGLLPDVSFLHFFPSA